MIAIAMYPYCCSHCGETHLDGKHCPVALPSENSPSSSSSKVTVAAALLTLIAVPALWVGLSYINRYLSQ